MSISEFVRPKVDSSVYLGGKLEHVRVDVETESYVPVAASLHKGPIKKIEAAGRILKFAEVVWILCAGASFFVHGRAGWWIKTTRSLATALALFIKGSNFFFNPYGELDEDEQLRHFLKLICPLLMMVNGLNGVVRSSISLLHIQIPKHVIQVWNSWGTVVGTAGSVAATVFMVDRVVYFCRTQPKYDSAKWEGGPTSEKDFNKWRDGRKAWGDILDGTKYLFEAVMCYDFIPDAVTPWAMLIPTVAALLKSGDEFELTGWLKTWNRDWPQPGREAPAAAA